MGDFDQVEPSTTSGYAVSLLLLGLILGVLTIRMKHQQQMEQLVEVTKDFKTFQATFMSEHEYFVARESLSIEQEQTNERDSTAGDQQPWGVLSPL